MSTKAHPQVVNGIELTEAIRLGRRYAAEIDKRGMPRAAQVFEALAMTAEGTLEPPPAKVDPVTVDGIQQLPAPGCRVDSGPVQFAGDDWPGIFLRGDTAGPYAMLLHSVIVGGGTDAEREMLKCLYALFRSCVVGGAREMFPELPLAELRPEPRKGVGPCAS